MKKIFGTIVLIFLIVTVHFCEIVNHFENKNIEESTFITKLSKISNQTDYQFEILEDLNNFLDFGEILIYGNYKNFNVMELKQMLKNPNKIFIFYDLFLDDNENINLEILKNHAVIYYYKNNTPYVSTLQSSSTSTQMLKEEITSFIRDKVKNILEDKTKMQVSTHTSNETFLPLYSGDFRKINKPYGYIDGIYNVKKYRANDISSLYLVETHVSFTPGSQATSNGSSGYGKWYNYNGYVHLKAEPAQNDVGYGQTRYGGIPIFKDAYPVNQPGQISISSTYNIGFNFGYSFKNGFSLDNISSEKDYTAGLNISYSYNKTYTTSEPALSAQRNAEDDQTYEWRYSYKDPRNETHHLYIGYMFEMNNKGHQLFEGDSAIRYNFKMTVNDDAPLIFDKSRSFETFYYAGFY